MSSLLEDQSTTGGNKAGRRSEHGCVTSLRSGSLVKGMFLEQSSKAGESYRPPVNSIPDNGTLQCKGPGAGVLWACSRNIEASVGGRGWEGGKMWKGKTGGGDRPGFTLSTVRKL